MTGEQRRIEGIRAELAAGAITTSAAAWRIRIAEVDEQTRLRAEAAYDRWLAAQPTPVVAR